MSILVFIEHKDCVLNKTSLEAIAAVVVRPVVSAAAAMVAARARCRNFMDCLLLKNTYQSTREMNAPEVSSRAFTLKNQ